MKMICPHCGLKGTAEETLVGKKVRCPECQQIFRVEGDVLATEAVSSVEQTGDTLSVDASEQLEEEQHVDIVETDNASVETQEEEEVVVELSDGVQVCSKCGFALSEQFLQETDSEIICSICAA